MYKLIENYAKQNKENLNGIRILRKGIECQKKIDAKCKL